jgi:DNA-binding XRE family transcriptional regulator
MNDGEQNVQALLTAADVYRIADDFSAGRSTQPGLAQQYGVCTEAIYNILAGRSWASLGIPILARNRGHKLSLDAARAIRLRYSEGGIQQKELAAQYGVSRATICLVLQGRKWPDAS